MKKTYIIILFSIFSYIQIKAQSPTQDTIKQKNIKEVVVNASKTDLLQKNAPMLVSIINSKTIASEKINDIGDLNARVPNLFMQKHGTRLTSPIYIRGIGSRINSPAIGLYVDGIPYFELGSFNFEMYDIKKIEVLRGPQGTLYGRNTMGGLINIITAQPDEKTQAYAYFLYGNYNTMKTVLHYNQPIGKKLIMLIDAEHSQSNGFFKNTYLNSPADANSNCSGRLKLQYKANKRLQTNFVLNYDISKNSGYPYALYDTTNQSISNIAYDQVSSYSRQMLSAGLKIKYTAKNFVLQNATSYQNLADTQKIDQDFTPKNLLFVNQNRTHKSFVNEFSIKSKNNAKIKWIAGIFAFKNIKNKQVDVYYNQDAVVLFHLPSTMIKYKTYKQPVEGSAVYGQVSLPLDKFTLTAGIRGDYEKDNLNYSYTLHMLKADLIQPNVDTFNTYFEILPKLNLSYRLNNNVFFYTSFTKGYKAGGFNSTFERKEDISFNPEYSYNYEAGIKSSLLNNSLFINASAFYIDWLNQQVYQPVPSGHGAMLKNAGHSMSKGLELEIRTIPVKNLQAWFYGGYNDVRYLQYKKDDKTDYSGNKIPYIPLYTSDLGLSYNINFNSKFFQKLTLTADYQMIGKFYWNDANTAYQKPYSLLNANIALKTKHFIFGVAGKNLLNTNYNAFYFEELGNSYAQKGFPMQISSFIKIIL